MKFDVIIGSDVLYESEHVDLLVHFLQQHAAAHCEIILVDPGRGNHARFSKKMVELGFAHSQYKPETETYLDKPFGGQVLRYVRWFLQRIKQNLTTWNAKKALHVEIFL